MQRLLITSSSTLLFFAIAASAIAAPITWSENGHEYDIIFANEISWQDARNGAVGLGPDWDLATITSAEEQQFIIDELLGGASGTRRQFWLGGYQEPLASLPKENWHWVIPGEDFYAFVNWGEGQPDDWPGDPAGTQYYLAIDSDQGSWGWDDNTSSTWVIDGYIVERHVSIPDASVLLLLGSACLVGFSVTRKRH
jgi:hypothetical protein